MNNIEFSSHAIDAFAAALCLAEGVDDRATLGQPILVGLANDQPGWRESVYAMVVGAQRMVIAIDESWLEDSYDDAPTKPMAYLFYQTDDNVICTQCVLHHSRKGVGRLCIIDEAIAFATATDGGWYSEDLDDQFVADAQVGFDRAASNWFWDYDERTTIEILAAIEELEMAA